MAIMLCGCASEKKTEEKQTQYKDGSYTLYFNEETFELTELDPAFKDLQIIEE